ncbi:unnamed protein product [Mytilus edulis]|uniref:Uncharacterized protein n=1 Tax=Mytilus edulis TaxID=6550 RepID=A0A8S3TQZ3_MYTED|nr:unnamed protein product [Mytilus edulis]
MHLVLKDTEVVKLLIDVDLNVNDRTHDFYTPLGLACFHGHYDIVKYFLSENGKTLDNSVDITIKIQKGWSVLHAACVNGNIEIVKELIDVGCNLNETNDDRVTPLYLASCLNGHTEVVKLLIDVGLKVNDTTDKGYTPLYLACQNGHYDIVKYLLDLNGGILNSLVDTTIKDSHGHLAFYTAKTNKHTDVVRLLTDAGMNEAEQRSTIHAIHAIKDYCFIQ